MSSVSVMCQCFPPDNVSSCVHGSLHFHPFLLCSIERGLLWLTGVTSFYHTHVYILSHHHCGYYNFHSCSDCYGDRDMHSPTLTWLECCDIFFLICSLEYCFSATSVLFIKAQLQTLVIPAGWEHNLCICFSSIDAVLFIYFFWRFVFCIRNDRVGFRNIGFQRGRRKNRRGLTRVVPEVIIVIILIILEDNVERPPWYPDRTLLRCLESIELNLKAFFFCILYFSAVFHLNVSGHHKI